MADKKICKSCGLTRPVSSFYIRRHATIQGSHVYKVLYSTNCKLCQRHICKMNNRKRRNIEAQKIKRGKPAKRINTMRRIMRKRNAPSTKNKS